MCSKKLCGCALICLGRSNGASLLRKKIGLGQDTLEHHRASTRMHDLVKTRIRDIDLCHGRIRTKGLVHISRRFEDLRLGP